MKTYQNLWDAVEVVLRGNFIALKCYVRKEECNQINRLLLPQKIEKEEQTKPKARLEGKIRIEIIKIEKQKINKESQT